jgi:hypothetical protein
MKYSKYCNDIVWVCYKKLKQIMGNKLMESEQEFKEWISMMVKEPKED